MSLFDEIRLARTKVVTDGYEMSVGELINLYKNDELVIDPVFQRLFRWNEERKTRFIESVLLGIPFPPIFVFQDENGIWELIDGLQRLSTIFQFTGDLKGERANELGSLILNGTKFLPSLNGKRWVDSSPGAGDGIGQNFQIEIKRARVRVEILKSESDLDAKFELFQRLNTGGASLTEQEVRNSIAVSINRELYDWMVELSREPTFLRVTNQPDSALDAQIGMELVLRFFAFRLIPYRNGLDVHEYLDSALITLASNKDFDRVKEGIIFRSTFQVLDDALGANAFKKWTGNAFSGRFLMSVFEVIATGVAHNIEAIEGLTPEDRSKFLVKKAKNLWLKNQIFLANSGAGVRGSTRLARLLPMAADFLRPAP